MGKFSKANGSLREGSEGSILLTALLFLMLFSSIFIVIFEDYRLTKDFYADTRNLYTAKIMKEIFLDEYYTTEKVSPSPVYFSTGTLSYTEKEQLTIVINIDGQVLTFFEKIRKITAE